MRLSLRFVLSLIGGDTAVSLVFALFQAGTEMEAETHEIQRQALILAESRQKAIEPLVQHGAFSELQAAVDRFQNHERLTGMAVYDANGHPLAITPGLRSRLPGTPSAVTLALKGESVREEFFQLTSDPMHVLSLPLRDGTKVIGAVAIFHDASYIGPSRGGNFAARAGLRRGPDPVVRLHHDPDRPMELGETGT